MALINGTRLEKQENDGLAVRQIARCLSRSTLDVGQLCGDINKEGVRVFMINKWTLRKPEHIEQLEPISDKQRAENNYGFDASVISTHGGNGAIKELFDIANAHGFDWPYTPAKAPYFRVLDFDGYYHKASAPWSLDSKGLTGVAAPTRIDCVRNNEAEIKLENMYVFTEQTVDPSQLYLGVITRKTGTDTTRLYVSGNTLDMMMGNESDSTNWSVDVPTFEEGETRCLFVLTSIKPTSVNNGLIDEDSENIDQAVTMWLPGCLQTYVVSAIENSILLRAGDDFFLKFYTTPDTESPQLLSVAAQTYLTNNNTGARQNVDVYVDLRFYEDENAYTTVQLSQRGDVPQNGYATFDFGPENTPAFVQEIENFDHVKISVRVRWTWAGQTRYFDFNRGPGNPSLSDPGFTTLADIESKGYTILFEVQQQ